MNKEVKNWLNSANYDMETARHMFTSGRYIYTVFMCHLALEKILKTKVQELTGRIPPRTHNLRYLVKLSKLEIPEDMFEFLSKLSEISIPTRYPKDFGRLVKSYNKKVAKGHLDKSMEIFKWIKKSVK